MYHDTMKKHQHHYKATNNITQQSFGHTYKWNEHIFIISFHFTFNLSLFSFIIYLLYTLFWHCCCFHFTKCTIFFLFSFFLVCFAFSWNSFIVLLAVRLYSMWPSIMNENKQPKTRTKNLTKTEKKTKMKWNKIKYWRVVFLFLFCVCACVYRKQTEKRKYNVMIHDSWSETYCTFGIRLNK